jgi:hypothetical protein
MIDKEKIRAEAKKIMDNFMQALKNVELEEEFLLERESCYREETKPSKLDEDFKQSFLKNAHNTSGDAIMTEKGAWAK